MQQRLIKIITFVIFCLFTKNLIAHPHVFVDVTTKMGITPKNIIYFNMDWSFDEFFSSQIITELGLNKNKKLSNSENEKIKNTYFQYLSNFNYFMNLKINKVPQKFIIKDFKAKIIGNKIIYSFTISLLNIHKDEEIALELEIKDPTNFSAFTPKKQLAYLDSFTEIKNKVSPSSCQYSAFLLRNKNEKNIVNHSRN